MSGRLTLSPAWGLSLVVVVVLSNPGCRHDIKTWPPDQTLLSYQCLGDVVQYEDVSQPLQPPAVQVLAYGGVGNPAQVPSFATLDPSSPGGPPPLWQTSSLQPGWVARSVPGYLRRATLARVHQADGASTRTLVNPFLTLDFAQPADVAGVYLAWDERATALPNWVAQQAYEPTGDVIETSYAPQPGRRLRLRVHRLLGSVPARLAFGGNNAAGAQWSGGAPGLPFLVLALGKARRSTNPVPLARRRSWEMCDSPGRTPNQLFETASNRGDFNNELQEWLGEKNQLGQENRSQWGWAEAAGLLELAVSPTDCGPVLDTGGIQKICGVQTVTLLLSASAPLVNGWTHHSRASVAKATSWAQVVVPSQNTQATTPLSGTVSFRRTAAGTIEMGEISLFGDPFQINSLSFDQVSFGQSKTLVAQCSSGLPVPESLCNQYRFPVDAFEMAGGARLNGGYLLNQLANEQAIDVSVDLNQRLFSFAGGPLAADYDLGNGPTRVEVTIFVEGHFDNFAPVPSLAETPDTFPCTDNRRGPVTLDARASTDLDQIGGLSYTWLEDAGLRSARTLGTTGLLNTTLNLGKHDVTVLVQDQQGITTSLTKTVEVVDEQLDDWSAPPDVWAVTAGDQTLVDIGQGSAADSCSGFTRVENDAPDDSRFREGLSLVEWRFDDYLGNLVTYLQKVFVLPANVSPPPIAWVLGPTAIPVGGRLDAGYGTLAQGVAVTADAYLALYGPGGQRWFLDPSGSWQQQVVVLTGGSWGLQHTGAALFVDPFEADFPNQGPYVLAHSLIRPGGNPDEPTDILALGWWPFVHGSADSPVFFDGFESGDTSAW